MREHRCPGGVKVSRFPGMSEVSGSNPGVCHVILLCYSHVQLSVVLRPRPRALLIPNLNRTSPTSITH